MLQAVGLAETDENLFIAASCKEKGIAFLKGEATVGVRKEVAKSAEAKSDGYTVTVNGQEYAIVLDGEQATVNGASYDVSVSEGIAEAGAAASSSGGGAAVLAPMPGAVVRINVSVGQKVSEGDTLVVLEAMKMEAEVKATCGGTVSKLNIKVGDQIAAGHTIAWVK
jgi:pyruvate carboxylase subunit B